MIDYDQEKQVLSDLAGCGWFFKNIREAGLFCRENEDSLPADKGTRSLFWEARLLLIEREDAARQRGPTIERWLSGQRMDPFAPGMVDDEGYYTRPPEPLAELCLDSSGTFSDSSLTDDPDGGLTVVDLEMDSAWWEEQFSRDAGLIQVSVDPQTLREREPQFDLNWDNRLRAGEERDAILKSFLEAVEGSTTVGELKGLSGKARWEAARNTGIKASKKVDTLCLAGEKPLPVRVFSNSLDFRRLAEVRIGMVQRLLELDPLHGEEEKVAAFHKALTMTTFTQGDSKDEAQARKVAQWVNGILLRKYGTTQKGQPHFQVNAVGVYPPDPPEEGEDLMDHAAREGEFMAEREEKVECPYCESGYLYPGREGKLHEGGLTTAGEICPLCEGYGEALPSLLYERVLLQRAQEEFDSQRNPPPRRVGIQTWKTLPTTVPFEFRTRERLLYHYGEIIPILTLRVRNNLSLPLGEMAH
jgi:hypothetical protein